MIIIEECEKEFTIPQVAKVLGTTRQNVHTLVTRKKLKAHKEGRGRGIYRIYEHDLIDYITRGIDLKSIGYEIRKIEP